MASVDGGRVVIFGAGGPVGATTMEALKDHYTLRCTDLVPLERIVAGERRQNPRAPLPPLLPEPHERRVVDVTRYDQVLEACRGMDAAVNVTVVRDHPEKAFTVNTVGAFHVARAAAECGLRRLIHTGPFHVALHHDADSWHDHDVPDEIPLHPGDDLYALTKYLGGEITRVFAERRGVETLTFLYCLFRPGEVRPEERGSGVGPFVVSWEDTGRAMLLGLRAPEMPSPHEVFLICAAQPSRKYRVDKARRLLDWEAADTWEELLRRS